MTADDPSIVKSSAVIRPPLQFPISPLLRGSLHFFDPGSLATEIPYVIQLGAADASGADHFNLVDHFRVKRKDSFHAVPEGNLANGESRPGTTVLLRNADALKNLDALFVAFLDFDVNLDGIARLESRNVRA